VATALTLYVTVVWAISTQLNTRGGDISQLPLTIAIHYPQVFGWIIAGIIGVMLGASFYKILSLNEGGLSIADSMGARLIDLNTTDEKERRLLNVVEEMSIASGYHMPNVGVLDNETNINAFAAALSPRDAIVVVTRGALEQLSRDELQAVIGHEFSHLLNGDSKMNITLAGWVFGLFFITIIGRALMRARGKKAGGAVMLGVAVFVIGVIGYLFGRLVQALISRQREFLADASSVQFTRNPSAMVSTLAKLRAGSAIQHPNASGLAHFFFGASSLLDNWAGPLATHPPLEARMKAIDANYELSLAPDRAPEALHSPDIATPPISQPSPPTPPLPMADAFPSPLPATGGLIGLIAATGSIPKQSLNKVSQAIDAQADPIKEALKSPTGAQAVILALVLPPQNRMDCLMGLQKEN